ncbi:MAG: DNA alkylation repair protein [Candidatus Methanoplasma sp.]|nr:DNA alkylation repair protein [Candidatus Methanoplasma sp.]
MIDVRKELEDHIDLKYRDFHMKSVPGVSGILGVRMPDLRRIVEDICKGDWREFLERPAEFYEEHMLRGLIIAGAKMDFDERVEYTKMFLPEINNWAICDSFCGSWKVKGAQDREKLWDYCLELIDTDDEYGMRVSAVMMMGKFMDSAHIDMVLELLTKKHHDGYYYKMGAAWALSCCYIKYPEKTEPLLFIDTLDKEIRNKAIQKISDSFRVSKEDKDRLKAKKKML